MRRTSGGRLAAAIIVGLAALPLSGCLYAQIPAYDPSAEEPTPAPSQTAPTTDPPDDGATGGIPATMTFADGADVPASAYIQWSDGLMFDDGWTSVTPDDGNGRWTDGTVDGTCTAEFWQGFTSDVATTPGDDSVSSDAMIAQLLSDATTAEITPLATTVQLGYQVSGEPVVDARQVTGAGEGREWTITARAFTATGVGLYVIVDCTGGDIAATFADIVDKNAVLITD